MLKHKIKKKIRTQQRSESQIYKVFASEIKQGCFKFKRS